MGLEDSIPVIYTDAFMGVDGWTFHKHNNNKSAQCDDKKSTNGGNGDDGRDGGGITASELFLDPKKAGYENDNEETIIVQKMYELYKLGKSDYTGRASVPVLWDRKFGCIVNNESSIMINMFAEQLQPYATNKKVNLLPDNMKESIEAMKVANYSSINNGVYRCGFAGSQDAYTEAATDLFQRLDELEELLSSQRYL